MLGGQRISIKKLKINMYPNDVEQPIPTQKTVNKKYVADTTETTVIPEGVVDSGYKTPHALSFSFTVDAIRSMPPSYNLGGSGKNNNHGV